LQGRFTSIGNSSLNTKKEESRERGPSKGKPQEDLVKHKKDLLVSKSREKGDFKGGGEKKRQGKEHFGKSNWPDFLNLIELSRRGKRVGRPPRSRMEQVTLGEGNRKNRKGFYQLQKKDKRNGDVPSLPDRISYRKGGEKEISVHCKRLPIS